MIVVGQWEVTVGDQGGVTVVGQGGVSEVGLREMSEVDQGEDSWSPLTSTTLGLTSNEGIFFK